MRQMRFEEADGMTQFGVADCVGQNPVVSTLT